MNQTLTPEQMQSIATIHVKEEFAGNVQAVMDTICADPHYELYPMGYRIRGRAAVMEMYRRMLPTPIGLAPLEHVTRKRAVGPDCLMSEDEAKIRDTDGKILFVTAVSVYSFEGNLLKGENVYFNDAGAALTMKALGPDFIRVSGVDKI